MSRRSFRFPMRHLALSPLRGLRFMGPLTQGLPPALLAAAPNGAEEGDGISFHPFYWNKGVMGSVKASWKKERK